MIRTRDFLLFVVVFVFILMGISVTVATDTLEKKAENTDTSEPVVTKSGTELDINLSADELDRLGNLAALRSKIENGEGKIIQGEPVFTSVDSPSTVTEDAAVADGLLPSSDRFEQYCVPQVTYQNTLSWPEGGATVSVLEGARVVSYEAVETVAVGSSTVSSTTVLTALVLPLTPQSNRNATCLDSPYVGVALDGSLIQNTDTWRFRGLSSESVVGYARDGYPIFGPGFADGELDECGGYDFGDGYGYHIRDNELFVLGCYRATPQSFTE